MTTSIVVTISDVKNEEPADWQWDVKFYDGDVVEILKNASDQKPANASSGRCKTRADALDMVGASFHAMALNRRTRA